MKFKKDLAMNLCAGVQACLIDTPELKRAEQLIVETDKEFPPAVQTVYTWDTISGFQKLHGPDDGVKPAATKGSELFLNLVNKFLLPRVPSKKDPGQTVQRGAVVVIVRNAHMLLTPNDGARICQTLQTGIVDELFNTTAEDGSGAVGQIGDGVEFGLE